MFADMAWVLEVFHTPEVANSNSPDIFQNSKTSSSNQDLDTKKCQQGPVCIFIQSLHIFRHPPRLNKKKTPVRYFATAGQMLKNTMPISEK